MSLTHRKTYLPLLLILTACGGGESNTTSGLTLEAILATNTAWPYELVGTLDIVEAGGYGETDYPSWAVGSVFTREDEWGVSISIGEGVVSRAKIDIDSGKEVRLWLEAPKQEYGVLTYPVSKIEALK